MKIVLNLLSASFLLCFLSCADGPKTKHRLTEAERAKRMQSFVIDLSASIKRKNPGFLIVPQNGARLAYLSANPNKNFNSRYLNAIDAFGIESLFFNGTFEPDSSRIEILKVLSKDKPVLVSEFITDKANGSDAYKKNSLSGFVPFVRMPENLHYERITQVGSTQNTADVTSMAKVKNYLYLINPSKFDTREEYIDALRKTNHDLLIVDLFFNDHEPLSPREVNLLKTKANKGKRIVLCYVNIGAAENWRYYWDKSWKMGNPEFLARKYHGYDNEFWVIFWDQNWKSIIYKDSGSYIEKIASAGFDGAYLDNIEVYKYLYSE